MLDWKQEETGNWITCCLGLQLGTWEFQASVMGMSHAEVCVVTAEKRCRRLQKLMFIQCSLKNVFFPVVTLFSTLGLRNLNILQGFFTNMYWWLQMNPGSVGLLQLAALTRGWIAALLERPQGRADSCCASPARPIEMMEKSMLWFCSSLWDMGCGKNMDVLHGCKGASCMAVHRALLPCSTQKLFETSYWVCLG